ncbi:MAG: TIGR03086 family metal-binding protein [Gemmatimonadaceae bacterium]|nr:TIGR03086 family metal-binding protein [Gemmatimonadaceae bacterium]
MNGADALERSGRWFRHRLAEVESDDWARPTPCDEWSVRDLVNHVVGGNFRYVMILAGEPADAFVRTREKDWLGSDPLGSFDEAFARVTAAFSVPGILATSVRHPKTGEITAAQLRVLRVNELSVHAWDLARAIDSDDRLDEQVVSWLLEQLEPLRSTVGLSEPGRADDLPAASPQESLLRLVGRAG